MLEPGQKVHLVGVSPWRAGVDSYFGSDAVASAAADVWDLPERGSVGDVVVVLVDARDRAVLSVEQLAAPWDASDSASRFDTNGSEDAFWAGVSVTAVELRTGEPVPAVPATLTGEAAQRLLDAIDDEHRTPTPWPQVDGSGCAAVVRDPDEEPSPWALNAFVCCTCGPDVRTLGLLPAVHTLQTHRVDEHDTDDGGVPIGALLTLCATCHTILHTPLGPSLAALAGAWRPRCPDEDCGSNRTPELVWGLPAFPLPPGTVTMGCTVVLDAGPLPRYRCGECGRQWAEED